MKGSLLKIYILREGHRPRPPAKHVGPTRDLADDISVTLDAAEGGNMEQVEDVMATFGDQLDGRTYSEIEARCREISTGRTDRHDVERDIPIWLDGWHPCERNELPPDVLRAWREDADGNVTPDLHMDDGSVLDFGEVFFTDGRWAVMYNSKTAFSSRAIFKGDGWEWDEARNGKVDPLIDQVLGAFSSTAGPGR